MRSGVLVHPSADVAATAHIGEGTKVWSNVQIREGATIGRECIFGRNSFVDLGVRVGDRVKVQNNASLYEGVEIDNGVFIGPHVVFTNDKVPRAINPDGTLKTTADWELGKTTVGEGAAVGAGAVVITGVRIGRWAMIGSGAVVTRDVPDHALVAGNPARVIGWVSASGARCQDMAEAVRRTAEERDKEHT